MVNYPSYCVLSVEATRFDWVGFSQIAGGNATDHAQSGDARQMVDMPLIRKRIIKPSEDYLRQKSVIGAFKPMRMTDSTQDCFIR